MVVLVLFLVSCGQNVSNPAVPSSENEEIVDREISVRAVQIRYVDTSGDDTSNDCLEAANPCSTIQHAIDEAAAGDTVDIAAGTYNEHDIIVDKDLILKGAGADSTVIDAEGLGRVILIEPDLESTIDSLTIAGGYSDDYPESGLNSFYERGSGGAIFNSGNLIIINVALIENIADFWGEGGGIYNEGNLTINSSTINNNSAGIPWPRGRTTGAGGGIFNTGNLTITESTISENSSHYSGYGGGILNTGNLTIINSTTSENKSVYGAGIANVTYGPQTTVPALTLTIISSTITKNRASNGGGIANYDEGKLTIIGSTISENYGSGIDGNGSVAITNSTISKNESGFNGGGIRFGGDSSSYLTITNSTISENKVTYGSGSGIYHHWLSNGIVNLKNIIVANDNLVGNCFGNITSQGYNLGSDGTCNLTEPTDQPNTDPKLEPLADNGGPTHTHALAAGSPALYTIPVGENGCGTDITTDQRGEIRPFGAGCEIGAFEVSPVEATSHLMDYVVAANLPQGTEQALLSSLNSALEKINAEQNHVASNILAAFVNKVNAQYSKKITSADADEFILLAEVIISGL